MNLFLQIKDTEIPANITTKQKLRLYDAAISKIRRKLSDNDTFGNIRFAFHFTSF